VGTGTVAGPTLETFWGAVADADRQMYADKAARRGTVGSMLDVDAPAAAGATGQGGLPMLPALG
jgi:hypothetical protein